MNRSLDPRPHVGSNVRTYMGNSRGHWEGNTLVVETANFNDKTGAAGAFFSDAAKLTGNHAIFMNHFIPDDHEPRVPAESIARNRVLIS